MVQKCCLGIDICGRTDFLGDFRRWNTLAEQFTVFIVEKIHVNDGLSSATNAVQCAWCNQVLQMDPSLFGDAGGTCLIRVKLHRDPTSVADFA